MHSRADERTGRRRDSVRFVRLQNDALMTPQVQRVVDEMLRVIRAEFFARHTGKRFFQERERRLEARGFEPLTSSLQSWRSTN